MLQLPYKVRLSLAGLPLTTNRLSASVICFTFSGVKINSLAEVLKVRSNTSMLVNAVGASNDVLT